MKTKMKIGTPKMKKMGAGGMRMMPDESMMKDSMMKKGGAKPKAMYGKTVKPSMMKKGGTTKKK